MATQYGFLHASDLHLGKPFGGYPEAIRGRLREARHTVLSRLAAAARAGGVTDVVLAGDTFDAETPSPETLRHALRAMAAESDLRWYVMPGNHDSLAATELWRRIAMDCPDNLVVLDEPTPVALSPQAWLLPAPCTQRRPGRDLTESMSAATPEGALRIGLGHGAITDFTAEEGSPGIIPPDRARLSGLDYLGLGDWHGQMQVSATTWYSGTPEADGFKHSSQAGALLVRLAAPSAPPEVTPTSTGHFRWLSCSPELLPGDDAQGIVESLLPPPSERRDALLRLSARGRLALADRVALEQFSERLAPDFGWFEADFTGLAAEVQDDDLDRIDRGGALRTAADSLMAQAQNGALAQDERDLARMALSRLFALVQDGAA